LKKKVSLSLFFNELGSHPHTLAVEDRCLLGCFLQVSLMS